MRNIGAKLLTDAAEKANDESGDGTTTCTVIAHSVLRAGSKYVGIQTNSNIGEFRRGV